MATKAKTIYEKAAQLYESGQVRYYGVALDVAGQPKPGSVDAPLQHKFAEVFGGDIEHNNGDVAGFEDDDYILALCFMAAMSK